MPSNLKKRLGKTDKNPFVIKKGFEGCIEMYSQSMWLPIAERISQIDDFASQEDRDFKRLFFDGAIEQELDSAGRIMLPKSLLEHAKIQKSIYIKCMGGKIEIWDKDNYENLYKEKSSSNDYMSALSNKVLGKKNKTAD